MEKIKLVSEFQRGEKKTPLILLLVSISEGFICSTIKEYLS